MICIIDGPSIGEDKLTSFNPINKTYTKVSYIGNRTIIPPGAATTTTINATERGNLTFNLQPNGISLVEGKSLLVTKRSNNGSKQENGTALLIDLNGVTRIRRERQGYPNKRFDDSINEKLPTVIKMRAVPKDV